MNTFTFKNKIIIHEASVSYEGDSSIKHIKNYYDNGKPWNEFTEVDGKKHGAFIVWDKNTGEKSSWEYSNGVSVKP